jgi:hypothetical protein
MNTPWGRIRAPFMAPLERIHGPYITVDKLHALRTLSHEKNLLYHLQHKYKWFEKNVHDQFIDKDILVPFLKEDLYLKAVSDCARIKKLMEKQEAIVRELERILKK